MRWLVAMCLVLAGFVSPAAAQQTAGFLGTATYATIEGCDKLKALANGGDRNISTVPETLTADGFEGWEHSCRVTSSTTVEAGQSWRVITACTEGESEWEETQVFEKASETSFNIKGEGEPMVYAVCDAPALPKED